MKRRCSETFRKRFRWKNFLCIRDWCALERALTQRTGALHTVRYNVDYIEISDEDDRGQVEPTRNWEGQKWSRRSKWPQSGDNAIQTHHFNCIILAQPYLCFKLFRVFQTTQLAFDLVAERRSHLHQQTHWILHASSICVLFFLFFFFSCQKICFIMFDYELCARVNLNSGAESLAFISSTKILREIMVKGKQMHVYKCYREKDNNN